jgi:hypothetical protein
VTSSKQVQTPGFKHLQTGRLTFQSHAKSCFTHHCHIIGMSPIISGHLFPNPPWPTKKTTADAGAPRDPDSTLAQRLHGAHSIASIWGVSKNWMGDDGRIGEIYGWGDFPKLVISMGLVHW